MSKAGDRSSIGEAPHDARRNRIWTAILIFAVVIAVYIPALKGGFIWDDDAHLTENPSMDGLSGLKAIWTTKAARICPLVLTSFWVQHALWGAKPLPYHLVCILMHAASTVVLWRVLSSLKVRGALLGAALWALHPVQVESVAWITELKNTQSGLFYLLAVLFFVKARLKEQVEDVPGIKGDDVVAIFCAGLAMASKSSTVILPLVLGLCMWWIDRRWQWRNALKLVPYLVLSAAFSGLSIWTQRLEGAADLEWARSWPERIIVSGQAIWFYLGKLFWPHPLIFIYPRWKTDPGQVWSYLPVLGVMMALFALWFYREKWGRSLFFGFVYFLAALLPVVGLINHFFLRYSFVGDHFQYLASIGPLVLAAAGIKTVGDVIGRKNRWVTIGICLIPLAAVSWQTPQYTAVFRDSETLWQDTLAKNPAAWIAHNNLGVLLRRGGEFAEAEKHFRDAVKLQPANSHILNNLGQTLAKEKRHAEAVTYYEAALKVNPDQAEIHFHFGDTLTELGRVDEAIDHYKQALQNDPDCAFAHGHLGIALIKKGKVDEAIVEFRQEIRMDPDNADAYNDLGAALFRKGNVSDAIAHYETALAHRPGFASAHNNLGLALLGQGHKEEAYSHFLAAITAEPDHVEAQYNFGLMLADGGNKAGAIFHLREAVRAAPDQAQVLNGLAWLLATTEEGELRNGAEALRLAQHAADITASKNPYVLDTLAAAYAETGRFEDAARVAQTALDIVTATGNGNLAASIRARVAIYRSGLPFRE